MEKLQLKNITLVIIDSMNLERAQIALNICEKYIDFGDVKLLTDLEDLKDKRIVKIEKIDSIKKYSTFCIKELNNYVNTDYCLLIQYDGFVLNHNLWKSEFLDYDYIGAPVYNHSGELCLNGGFSLRSKKLLTILQDSNIKTDLLDKIGEDYFISFVNRQYLTERGIKFPEHNIAESFSIETSFNKKDSKDVRSFGYHGISMNLNDFFLKNPEFRNLNKFNKGEVVFLKSSYSKILKSLSKYPFIRSKVRFFLLIFKKIYYSIFY